MHQNASDTPVFSVGFFSHHRHNFTVLRVYPNHCVERICKGTKGLFCMPPTPVGLWIQFRVQPISLNLPQPRRLSPAARCASGTPDLVNGRLLRSKSSGRSRACANTTHNVRCSSFFTIFTVLDVGMAWKMSGKWDEYSVSLSLCIVTFEIPERNLTSTPLGCEVPLQASSGRVAMSRVSLQQDKSLLSLRMSSAFAVPKFHDFALHPVTMFYLKVT